MAAAKKFTATVLALLAATAASPLAPLQILRSRGGVLDVSLHVVPGVFKISSKLSLRTRTYNASVPGPFMRVKRGDLLRMRLVNQLAGGDGLSGSKPDVNATNLHLHGMHLPATPLDAERGTCGDNIKCIVHPGRELTFEYRIPADHPTGTFWYHPHVHGTTALQVGGLMAGAIVVEDDPRELSHSLEQMPDVVLLIQMLHYEAIGAVTHAAIVSKRNDQDFSIYEGPKVNTILVNGQFMPSISLRSREAQRLRLINANEVANFELVVSGGSCSMFSIAYDGVYLDKAVLEQVIILPVGGRADVVMVCHDAGEFLLTSERNSSRDTLMGHHGRISAPIMRLVVTSSAPSAAEREGSEGWGPRCEGIGGGKCGADGGIGNLPARPPYMQGSLASAPLLADVYDLKMGQRGAHGQSEVYLLNDKPYLEAQELVPRVLSLGAVDEWRLWTDAAPGTASHAHPFHAHVNHFQVIGYEMDEGVADDHHLQEGNGGSPSGSAGAVMKRLVGQWRDTLLVPAGRTTIRIRFLPVAWCGEMVRPTDAIPPHILDSRFAGGVEACFGASDPVDVV